MIDLLNKVTSVATSIFDLNESSISGGVDVIVVRQKDGSLKGTGFHVRFGKFHVLKSRGQKVEIQVNNRPTKLTMKLGDAGEGYFEEIVEVPENHSPLKKAFDEVEEMKPENPQETSYKKLPELHTDASGGKTRRETMENGHETQMQYEVLPTFGDEHATVRVEKSLLGTGRNKEGKEDQIHVERLVHPGSSNNPKKVKVIEYIQSKIEQGKQLGDKVKSLIGGANRYQKEEGEILEEDEEVDDENVEEKDEDVATNLLKQIEKGIEYDFFISENGALSPISRFEIGQDPEEVVRLNLLLKVRKVEYKKTVALYVLALLLGHPMNYFTDDANLKENGFFAKKLKQSSTIELPNWNEGKTPKSSSSLGKTPKSSSTICSITSKSTQAESVQLSPTKETTKNIKMVRKSLRLTSEELKSLDLKPGVNTISYTIHTSLQNKQTISANLYLWESDTKIIVTDVDGTVTKSDVLGAILPMIGKDWSQPGIVPLFANIRRNGYQIIYLTSRAIGQIRFTRSFVNNLHQDGIKLPSGPIISSPDRLMTCFRREFIQSRPEYFKAAALRDIKNLFPTETNPFYAAFGNRENDAVAYRYVGIPLENIYTVNSKGDVHHSNLQFKSFPMMNARMKEAFPCIPSNLIEELKE